MKFVKIAGILLLGFVITLSIQFLHPSTSASAQASQLVIGMAVHSDPTGSFWNVVDRGFKDAGKDLNVKVISNGSLDPAKQAQFIEDYVAQKVDGIVVSLAAPDALKDAIGKAVKAGIPVISINSGAEVSASLGALAHVGQTESVAGQGAGKRLASLNVKHVLCVIHEESNVGLQDRCKGVAATFSGKVDNFSVASTGVNDLAGTGSAIQNKLIADATIDAVMALNPDVAGAAADAIKASGKKVVLATFDLSPVVLDGIKAGTISFAIDQQQYLQGYLPVLLIKLYKQNLNVVGGGLPILTGPGFVDNSNVDQVKTLVSGGTR